MTQYNRDQIESVIKDYEAEANKIDTQLLKDPLMVRSIALRDCAHKLRQLIGPEEAITAMTMSGSAMGHGLIGAMPPVGVKETAQRAKESM